MVGFGLVVQEELGLAMVVALRVEAVTLRLEEEEEDEEDKGGKEDEGWSF